MKKPRMVKAWAFAVVEPRGSLVRIGNGTKSNLREIASWWRNKGARVGPIVRISVPAPIAEKP